KTEINEIIGNVVPINPSEISVNNGPSLIASIDKPPTSERLPYVLVKAAYMPLLLFVIAAIMAIVDNPNKPFQGSNSKANKRPTARPEKYLVVVNSIPFLMLSRQFISSFDFLHKK